MILIQRRISSISYLWFRHFGGKERKRRNVILEEDTLDEVSDLSLASKELGSPGWAKHHPSSQTTVQRVLWFCRYLEPNPVLEKERTKWEHFLLQADTKAQEAPFQGAILAFLVTGIWQRRTLLWIEKSMLGVLINLFNEQDFSIQKYHLLCIKLKELLTFSKMHMHSRPAALQTLQILGCIASVTDPRACTKSHCMSSIFDAAVQATCPTARCLGVSVLSHKCEDALQSWYTVSHPTFGLL